MIKFEEELEKFKPELTIGHIEESIEDEDMKDFIDMIEKVIQTIHE